MAGVNLQHLVMKTGGELLVGGDLKAVVDPSGG